MPSNCKLLFLLSLQLGMFCVVGNVEFMQLNRVTLSLSIPKSIGSGLGFFFGLFIGLLRYIGLTFLVAM